LAGGLVLCLAFSIGPAQRSAGAPSALPAGVPLLFYTSNHPAALKAVQYSTSGGVLRVGAIHVVATLPEADGLGLAPDGNLIVGGGKTGDVYKVDPVTGKVQSVTSFPGSVAAFHITVSPDGSYAFTSGLPGQLAKVPLHPFGPGVPVSLKGDDPAVTTVGFTPVGTFYTASDSFGSGRFGSLDLTTLTTKRVFPQLRGAHGIAYDSFTKDLFLVGAYAIVQIDPVAVTAPNRDHQTVEVSSATVGGMAFDQGVADGHGHLLVASNTGEVWFLDYSTTGLIGSSKVVKTSHVFLDTNLDDIVVVNPIVAGTPPPSKKASSSKSKLLLPIAGVVVLAIAVAYGIRRRRAGSVVGKGDAGTF
jgi:hypothetical protein